MIEQEKPYIVKYKLKSQLLWRKVKNVVGDAFLSQHTKNEAGKNEPWPVISRLLILEDGTRLEIPGDGTAFKFSKQRQRNLELRHNKEAKQKDF